MVAAGVAIPPHHHARRRATVVVIAARRAAVDMPQAEAGIHPEVVVDLPAVAATLRAVITKLDVETL